MAKIGAAWGEEPEPQESLTQEEEILITDKGESKNLQEDIDSLFHDNTTGGILLDDISYLSNVFDAKVGSQGWRAPKSRKAKKPKIVVASRNSNRVSRDGVPIAEKAAKRAAAKDTGNSTKNPFTILNNTSNEELIAVIQDPDIEISDPPTQLDVFKLEELARAATAEANYKQYLEKLSVQTTPRNEEEENELAMEVILNNERLYQVHNPKGDMSADKLQAEGYCPPTFLHQESYLLECEGAGYYV